MVTRLQLTATSSHQLKNYLKQHIKPT